MTATWEDVLDRWGEALNLRYEVYTQTAPEAHAVGEWWSVDGRWHLRVADSDYVVWRPVGPDERVRAALTWTLRTVRGHNRQTWRQYALHTLAELLQPSGNESYPSGRSSAAGTLELQPLPDEASLQRLLPGYFIWLHGLSSSGLTMDNEEVAELRTSVEEVVSAVAPNSWVGWLQTPAADPVGSALLIWPLAKAADDRVTEYDTAATSAAVRELNHLSHQVSELVSQLETDALLPARVVVGSRVDSPRDLRVGLTTLASAWFASLRLPNRSRVSVWGQMPIEIMVQYLPEFAIDEFIQIAGIRAANRQVKVTHELEETLQGIIAANLNVSEAARILYVHRNTLINRIERIREQTGYDIRHFQDALVLWLLVSLGKEPA